MVKYTVMEQHPDMNGGTEIFLGGDERQVDFVWKSLVIQLTIASKVIETCNPCKTSCTKNLIFAMFVVLIFIIHDVQ